MPTIASVESNVSWPEQGGGSHRAKVAWGTSGPRTPRRLHFGLLAGLAALFLGACKPTLVIGELFCETSTPDGGLQPNLGEAVELPWSTSFENGTCDYTSVSGFCFSTGPAGYEFVKNPVHSGNYAAAFTVATGTDAGADGQVRCVNQGVFPKEAYFGAWIFIPVVATVGSNENWNLFHFQGGDPPAALEGLWDVSLVSQNGTLNARLFGQGHVRMGDAPTSPIGKWFHLVFYLKRAKDKTGEVALYQDEKLAFRVTNVITDPTDWGQWYVGNLATDLVPPTSTIYVDDVTIKSTL